MVLAASGRATSGWPRSRPTCCTTCWWRSHQRGLPLARVMDELRRRRRSDGTGPGEAHEGAGLRGVRSGSPTAGGRCRSSASSRATCGRRCRPSCRSPPAPSGPSCSRASSAASGWRATRSSAATPSRGSRCGPARWSCTTTPARARRRTGLLEALRARLGSPPAEVPGLPRFTGGAVGYLTWDAARLFERLPDHHGAAQGTVASFAFYRSLVAFDHVRQRLVLIALAEPGSRAAFDRAQQVLDGFEEDLGWERRPSGDAPVASRRAGPPARRRRRASARPSSPAKEHIARRRHLPGRALAPAHRRLRASTPSPSTARCAWSTRRPTCTS